MEPVESIFIGRELFLKLILCQVELLANGLGREGELLEARRRIPVKAPDSPFDQVFERTNHLVAAHISKLGP
jgi:hypothetical protein